METSKNITIYIIIYVILLTFLLSNIKEKTAIFSVLLLILILKSGIKINNMIVFIVSFMFVIQSMGLIQSNNVYESMVNNNITGRPIKYTCDGGREGRPRKCNNILDSWNYLDSVPIHKTGGDIIDNFLQFVQLKRLVYEKLSEVTLQIEDDRKRLLLDRNYTPSLNDDSNIHKIHDGVAELLDKLDDGESVLNKLVFKIQGVQDSVIEGFPGKYQVKYPVKYPGDYYKGKYTNCKIPGRHNYHRRKFCRGEKRKERIQEMRSAGSNNKGGVNETLLYHVISKTKVGLTGGETNNGGLLFQYIELGYDDNILSDTKPVELVKSLVKKLTDREQNNYDHNSVNKNFYYGNSNRWGPHTNDINFNTPETIVHRINFNNSFINPELQLMKAMPSIIDPNPRNFYALLYTGWFNCKSGQYKLKLTSNNKSCIFITQSDPFYNGGIFSGVSKKSADDAIYEVDEGVTEVTTDPVNGKKFITIVCLVDGKIEELSLKWKKHNANHISSLYKWQNVLTKNKTGIFNSPYRPDIQFFYKTYHYLKNIKNRQQQSKGNTNTIMLLSADIDYNMGENVKLFPIVSKESFSNDGTDDTQCARLRHGAQANYCHGRTHVKNLNILKEKTDELKVLMDDLMEDAEKQLFDKVVLARKKYVCIEWLQLLIKIMDRHGTVSNAEKRGLWSYNASSSEELNKVVENDERVIDIFNLIKKVRRATASFYIKNKQNMFNININFNEVLKFANNSVGIDVHNLSYNSAGDADAVAAELKIFKDNIYLTDHLTGQARKLFPRRASNGVDDALYNNVWRKYNRSKKIIYKIIRNNRINNAETSIERFVGEHFREGINSNKNSEQTAIQSLYECLNNHNTLKQTIVCFKTKINDPDSWFNDYVEKNGDVYIFKGDFEYLSDNMKIILPFLINLINIYYELETFVNQVVNAMSMYIKNGPEGLVKLFELEYDNSDNLSYIYLRDKLGELMDDYLINQHSVDNDIIQRIQDTIKNDQCYIYFEQLDLANVKSRVNIITKQELYNISQHYRGKITDYPHLLPYKLANEICGIECDTDESTEFLDSNSSACCFMPNGVGQNYPPAKLY